MPPLLAHVSPNYAAPAGPRGWAELPFAWELDFLVLVALALSATLYIRGSLRLRAALVARKTPAADAESGSVSLRRLARRRLCFWAGWGTLFLALASPLHPWGQVLFSAHMVQHELLMLVAAPLLVLGRPWMTILFAFHRDDARSLSRVVSRPGLRVFWRLLAHPVAAWAVHAFALWLWHVPALFDATLRHEWVHHAQHLSFFGSALLFWWALFLARPVGAATGAALLYLFTTMLHTGLLGALLVFADALLYRGYVATAADWSLTPLEDQQLGGLLMWAPGGLVYVVVALALLVRWLRAADREPSRASLGALSRSAPLALCVLLFLPACSRPPVVESALAGGDPEAGRLKIKEYGCAACHTIPGIPGATTVVGPPLTGIGSRNYLGGTLPNTPENRVRWILDPAAHNPRTVMPKLVTDEQDARDIAAYLATLR